MSHSSNTNLMERAADMVDFWQGTVIAKTIERDLDVQDFDALLLHITLAEGQASQEEIEATNAY